MDTKHREVLRKRRRYIIENVINIEDVCDELYSCEPQILDNNMKEEIMVSGSIASMNRKLLDTITYRGSKAFGLFVEALKNTGNAEVAENLASLGHIESLPPNAMYCKNDKQQEENSQDQNNVQKCPIEESSCQEHPQQPGQEKQQQVISGYPENWPNPKPVPVKQSDDSQLHQSLSSEKEPVYDTLNTETLVITVGSVSRDVHDAYKNVFENENMIMNGLFSKAFKSVKAKTLMNKKAEDIPTSIQKIVKDTGKIGCFILVALTAGKDPGQIYGKGGSRVDMKVLEDICKQCENLKDIPKVFIINSYPPKDISESVATMTLDATAEYPTGENDDDLYIITWKCMEGYDQFIPDIDNPSNPVGSWFVQALKYVLENFNWELDLFKLIDKANWLLANARVNKDGQRGKAAEIVFLQMCKKKLLYL